MHQLLDSITQPTLLLNATIARNNIRKMAEKARRLGIRLRPHLKTPQAHEVARWFREEGVSGLTVSSLRMAEYFAKDNWRDITVAFPLNIRELATVEHLLNQNVQLNLLVENTEAVKALQETLKKPIDLFIKINFGNNRAGLMPQDKQGISAVIQQIEKGPHTRFAGFLGHPGQTYQARGQAEILAVHQESLQIVQQLRTTFGQGRPALEISLEDTPGAVVGESFDGVDELRPGNFVFFDLMQQQIGSCDWNDIAVCMACPVVAKHPDRREIVLYGGAVHFSKDRIEGLEGRPIYGFAVRWTDEGWSEPDPQAHLFKLSQEHGMLRANEPWFEQTQIGDLIGILPVHSCLTADLMKRMITLKGATIETLHA